ncbi:MAG: hypothetical protein JWN94_3262 [Betaproteobacteria bacterium]|nr:hypothetical protein [Betaproteobacteria bacterium]
MRVIISCLVAALFVVSCGGGTGGDGGPTASPPASAGCSGGCSAATPTALTVAEVNRIVSQAVQEAQARGALGTMAVVDRSGNVLAVFQMTGAGTTLTISGGRGVVGGLDGQVLTPAAIGGNNPVAAAAISKALTGAYLSSEGNAFSTRTASQIVQDNFNPGEIGSPGGPLFGVQFSSLSCSDVVLGTSVGPRPSPLGLSADPGGVPLYKNGIPVGGFGVIADGLYSLDLNVNDVDSDLDELIAVAAATGFAAPVNRRGDRITVDGRTLRYLDSESIISNPAAAPALPAGGALIAVPGYKPIAAVTAGVAFSTAASGFRLDTTTPEFAGLGAYVLDTGAGVNRFPPTAGAGGLTAAEVTRILAEGIRVANRARAQIRQPLGSPAQVTISVVDTNAAILGIIRTPDAPVFGTDVAVQKARSALLFSKTTAALSLNSVAPSVVLGYTINVPFYVTAMQTLIPGALTNGIAYANRSIGNLARPFLPDGINGNPNGPLSKTFGNWSPFTDGLQLDLVLQKVVTNLVTGPGTPCSPLPEVTNGIQIFPGSVPIFRGAVLVGAIGISGDGIDQDDMVAFLGLANAGTALGTGIANAPALQRADQIAVPGGLLRFVNCPVAPFLDTSATNVCNGI